MGETSLEAAVRNLHEQVQDLLTLSQSARKVLTAPTLEAIAQECFAALQCVAPKAGRALYLRTEDGLDFVCKVSEGEGCEVEPGAFIAVPLDVVDWVCQNRRHTTLPGPEGRTLVVVPLAAGEEVVGLLELALPAQGDALPRKLLDELAYLGGQTAAAVQNVALRARLESEHRVLARTGVLLHDILESINHGIVTLDEQGRIAMINRNAGSMLRVDTADLQGKDYREAFSPEVVKTLDGIVEQTRVQGFAMDQQMIEKGEEGLELNLGIGGTALLDGNGKPAGVIVICRDMTATKELERLRALDQMKSQFVSNVSHELRTPLTSIKAYTDALTTMVEGETPQKFLKVVDEEADRLLGMIEDLLNVSRIESGKFRLQWEPVDVRAMVESILAVSKVQSDRHRIVTAVAPSVPATVPMDKNKMKEVLINLVNNAIKYSPDGGEVRLDLRFEEGNLKIDVKDQGMGLSPENQKKLFQMFFRTEQAQAAQIRGTGLGLAITKGITEAHGGVIRVSSEGEGKGSTFTVLLPVRASVPKS